MKFTSEDLMKAMGLSVGDRVKVGEYSETFELMKSTEGKWRLISKNCSIVDLIWLVDKDYEILPRPKRVGDLKCKDNCGFDNCPLDWLCANHQDIHLIKNVQTKYEVLEALDVYDQEIYDLLKARLDKVVE